MFRSGTAKVRRMESRTRSVTEMIVSLIKEDDAAQLYLLTSEFEYRDVEEWFEAAASVRRSQMRSNVSMHMTDEFFDLQNLLIKQYLTEAAYHDTVNQVPKAVGRYVREQLGITFSAAALTRRLLFDAQRLSASRTRLIWDDDQDVFVDWGTWERRVQACIRTATATFVGNVMSRNQEKVTSGLKAAPSMAFAKTNAAMWKEMGQSIVDGFAVLNRSHAEITAHLLTVFMFPEADVS
jgi:hypothetical protein